MGELDSKAFLNMCKRKFAAEDAEAESAILCSKWQDEIKNPEWNPFKVIMVNGNVLVRVFAFVILVSIVILVSESIGASVVYACVGSNQGG